MIVQPETPAGAPALTDNAIQKPLHVQQTIAALQREFVGEALRIAATKAAHAADDLAIGDDLSAERAIRISILNLREAAAAFRHLEALTSAIDALSEKGAAQ
jgi:hypothetical protein